MASLVCEDCKSPVQWSAPGCAACGAMFREIRCAACRYVGGVDQFPNHRCSRCGKEKFLTISREEMADEVGSEAFVGDGPLEDDIERGFGVTEPKRPEPLKRIRAQSGEPESESKEAGARDAARESDRAEPRPVLKRKRWRTDSEESDAETAKEFARQDERAPREPARNPVQPLADAIEEDVDAAEKRPRKSLRQEPITSTKSRRFSVELSPKTQQILRWSAMTLPVILIAAVAWYWFAPSGNRRPRRSTELATGVDAGVLEAEAARLYQAAVEYYRAGQTEPALSTLQEIISRYPLTSSGPPAREAVDRMNRGEPPFGDEVPRTVSEPNQPPPAPPTESPVAKRKPAIGIPIAPPQKAAPPSDAQDDSAVIGSAPRDPRAPPAGSTLAKSDAKPRALPPGFEAVPAAGVHSSGWPIEIISAKDGSHMMLVPAGEFDMGSADGAPNVRPPHRIALKTYYIDRFEVTLGRYKRSLEQRQLEGNPYASLSAAALAVVPTDRHPVVGVAWRDANAYAQWAGKSLPTEAQWERAARGSDGRAHPWGTGQPTWEKPREPKQLDRVGSFAWDVSPFGCFDMAGNAWEWCADWYDPNFYATSPREDPAGPKVSLPPLEFTEAEKTLRGGSPDWLVTWRAPCGINESPLHVGFRCVLNVEEAAPTPPPQAVVAPASPSQPVQRQPAPSRVPPGGFKF